MAALVEYLRGSPAPVRAALAGYRIAVASRHVEALPSEEMALLRACAAEGRASVVYALTQRVRAELGMPRRERMDPEGRGKPKTHPEGGGSVKVTIWLPGDLVAAVDAVAEEEHGGSRTAAMAALARDGLASREGA